MLNKSINLCSVLFYIEVNIPVEANQPQGYVKWQ